ncbi:MFS transporter [Neobacillus kokaensis]|uniref:MFS transporter n=1 Tax=Neobacillus kokaensis TaxID=2759023 RepID=A0ABQ3MYF9_9BACI|nr:MFS transporter [Neobacillus kokaensis]GHH96891.1 MFS transporter [Neobacillus kokaensis]
MRTYNEKISIYHGMVSTIALNLASNYFPIFAITILGATNYQVGLISSLPPLVALIVTIPAAILLNRLEQQKKIVALNVFGARAMFLLLIGVAFLPPAYQAWVFLLIIALMNVPGTISNIGWQTLISGMISEERRGTFFSDRNRLLTVVGMVTMLIIGIVMKKQSYNPAAYQILFLLAFIFGLMEMFFLFKHKETVQPKTGASKQNSYMDWSIFKNQGYKLFLIAALCFNFTWQMAWGIFNIYNVKYAHVTILWISIFSVGNQLVQIFTFPLWKKWAERKSNTLVFVWVAVGMATAPSMTVLSTNLYYLTFVQMTSGFFVSGTTLLLFNLLLEKSPKETRTYCITTYNVLLSFVAFIAPQIGIWLLETTGVHLSMHINSLLRFMSAVVFFVMYLKSKTSSSVSSVSGTTRGQM